MLVFCGVQSRFLYPLTADGKKWFHFSEFPLQSLDFQIARASEWSSSAAKGAAEVDHHVRSNSGLSCLEILPDNIVGKPTSTHCKSSS